MRIPSFDRICRILLAHWDPIGVGDAPDAADEYDRYAAEVLRMIEAGEGREGIESYLDSVAVSEMGLSSGGNAKRAVDLICND